MTDVQLYYKQLNEYFRCCSRRCLWLGLLKEESVEVGIPKDHSSSFFCLETLRVIGDSFRELSSNHDLLSSLKEHQEVCKIIGNYFHGLFEIISYSCEIWFTSFGSKKKKKR